MTLDIPAEAEPKISMLEELIMVASKLRPVGDADPKMSIFVELEIVALSVGPLGNADPKISTLEELLTDATVGVGESLPNTAVVILLRFNPLAMTPFMVSTPLPNILTSLPPVTVTVLPTLAVPKMSMSLELETLMVETAVEADPKASIDWLLPPLVA